MSMTTRDVALALRDVHDGGVRPGESTLRHHGDGLAAPLDFVRVKSSPKLKNFCCMT
jgi:hypothetical protein